MRNTLFLLLALLVNYSAAIAQPETSLSEPFEEPVGGYNKLLLLENGNTFFFHFTKGGLEVTVYDKNHKMISQKELEGKDWDARKLKTSTVNGLHEINGEPVMFFTQLDSRAPQLFRLRFDPQTGQIIEEKIIATIDKYKAGSGYAMAFGGVDPNSFYVEKDPNSNSYAVVCYHSFSQETAQRIKVVHFSGTHQELSQSYFGSPGNFKYLRYISMAVTEKSVITATYGFNTEAKGGKDSRVIISRLKVGDNEFAHELLDFTDDFKNTTGMMQYNPGNKKIQLLTTTLVESDKPKTKFFSNDDLVTTNYYMVLLSYIDPETLTVTDAKQLSFSKVSQYQKDNMMPSKDFVGLPQDMFINPDYSTTIITEELRQTVTTGRGISYSCALGNIGISDIDLEGNETRGTAIPKMQTCYGIVDAYDHSDKSKGMWRYLRASSMGTDDHFFSFDYVSTENGRYILFNDLPLNFTRTIKQEKENLGFISGSNTTGYTLGNDQHKYYLFGKPEGKDVRSFCYIKASHTLRSSNTYATLIVEKNGGKKQSRIAWLTFK